MLGVVPGGPFRRGFEVGVFREISVTSVREGGHEVGAYPGGGPSLYCPVPLAFIEKVDFHEGIYSLINPSGYPFFAGILGSPFLFYFLS